MTNEKEQINDTNDYADWNVGGDCDGAHAF